MEIPLRRRNGEVVAVAIVDEIDADLAQLRWHVGPSGYAARGRHPDFLYLHRVVLGRFVDREPNDGLFVDHINRDPMDNRRANLRLVTPAQSRHNASGSGGRSRFRGVYYHKQRRKWIATARLAGHRSLFRRFDTEIEAAEAAARWRAEHTPFPVQS